MFNRYHGHDEHTDRYYLCDQVYEVELMLRRPWHHPLLPIDPMALPPEEALARLREACREDMTLHPTLWGCEDLWRYVVPDLWGDFFMDALEREIMAGNVAIIRLEKEWWPTPPPWPGTETGPGAGTQPGARPVTDTWFELRVIDEMGEPIPGVELVFSFDRQTHVTDGDGRIRIDPVPARFHETRVRTPPGPPVPPSGESAPLDSLRAAVKPRWDQIRPGPRYEPRADDLVVPLHGGTPIDISLLSERARTIVVVPWVVRARFGGFYFNYGRCFLRPDGLADLRAVCGRLRRGPPSAAVVVGHTRIGDDVARGERVSLQRAEAFHACLRQDVDAWLGHYKHDSDPDERWGPREDQLMLCALPDAAQLVATGDTIAAYQQTRALEPSGAMDEPTRRRLIRDYFAVSGLPLADVVRSDVCACGPHSRPAPADLSRSCHEDAQDPPVEGGEAPTAASAEHSQDQVATAANGATPGCPKSVCEFGCDGDRDHPAAFEDWAPRTFPPDLREVELYLFDAALGPQPPVAGRTAQPETTAPLEWSSRARVRLDHKRLGEELSCHLSFVVYNDAGQPLKSEPYALDLGDHIYVRGVTDEDGGIALGDVAAGDYALCIRGVELAVPAINKAEHRRPLRLGSDWPMAR